MNVIRCLAFWLAGLGGATLVVAGAELPRIEVDIFDPGFLEGDCNYHSLTAASDGRIYFAVGTHELHTSAQLHRFDPVDETMERVADLGEVLGTDVERQIPHGKVHTPLLEHEGSLYFATHTSGYINKLPLTDPPDGREPYPGGHFMRYDLATGEFEDFGGIELPNEGVISMAVDPAGRWLYGLTWPSGILMGLDRETGRVRNWGAVQGRGEWDHFGADWEFICRRLGMAPDGLLYGSDQQGRIWSFDVSESRPLSYFQDLDLDRLPAAHAESFEVKPEAHYYWRNWRTILWNPNTQSFWGLHGGSTQLFEFDPARGRLRSVASLAATGLEAAPRNPRRTQLGFQLGPNNTLYYLAHGDPVEVPGRPAIKASVHMLTYQIDTGEFKDHGVLIGADGRRICFTESLDIGADGNLYTAAWVETIDRERQVAVQEARGGAAPDETNSFIYEIQLVRIPGAALGAVAPGP